MKSEFSKIYQRALLNYLTKGPSAPFSASMRKQAANSEWQALEIANLHEQILINRILPGRAASEKSSLIKRAGNFFSEVVTLMNKVESGPGEAAPHWHPIVEVLSQRTVELAASNEELQKEIARCRRVEEELKKSELHYAQLLERSDRLQEESRRLSRQILSAQEDERKKISRELHDVIAQTLTGINVRLATLKKEVSHSTKGLDRNIARTQKLVGKSVEIVHQFARELRPAVLDDLGLIPALQSFMKNFSAQTGVRTHLRASASAEKLDTAKRTTLFRVAQEALTNVARHAEASRVTVVIQEMADSVSMKISDDGKSFPVQTVLLARATKRLGLLGMRERLEMVGGRFKVESAAGKGTTITAAIPLGKKLR